MKKFATTIAAVFVLLYCIIPVFAVGKVSQTLICTVADINSLPAGTVYIDLLLPTEDIRECYAELNRECVVDTLPPYHTIQISADSNIAKYNEDGFCSYIAHFENAKITVTESGNNEICVTFGSELNHDLSHFQKCDSLKLAFVDESGNVIKTTEPFSVRHRLFAGFQKITLNGENVKCDYFVNPYSCVCFVVLVTLGTVMIVKIVKKANQQKKNSHG